LLFHLNTFEGGIDHAQQKQVLLLQYTVTYEENVIVFLHHRLEQGHQSASDGFST